MPTPELTQCVIDLALSDPVRHAAHAVALRQHSARVLRQPVSVVGPREASDVQLQCAYRVGRLLGSVRVPVLCGGKNGVMASVSRGVSESGGIVVGLLPEDDTSLANPHLTVALPTGLGITRNALVARASAGVAVDPNIRATVNRDTRVIADQNTSFIDSLIFWQSKDPPGTIINPRAEQQRLRDAEASGKASSAPTPTIERRKRGLLEGIF